MAKLTLNKNMQIFVVITILIFTTKYFQSTPFEELFFKLQVGYILILVIFLIVYIINILLNHQNLNKFIMFILLLITILPVYSAYRAYVEFGQPMLYGFLAQRGWALLGSGILIYYLLISKKVTFVSLENSFILMAWLSLFVYTFLILTYDPSQLNSDTRFALMTEARGLRLKLSTFFITFMTVYSFIEFSMNKNNKYFIIFIIFLSYVIFFNQGRTYLLELIATLLIFIWGNFNLNKKILFFLKSFYFILIAFILIEIFSPNFLERMNTLYLQMFDIFLQGESQDMSSNARIWQAQIVLNYFTTHSQSFWFGTGMLSNHWNDGYKSVFGYFYPSDIGLLGVLFLYGLFGMFFVYFIPIYITFKIFKSYPKNELNTFILSMKYIIVFMVIASIPTGNIGRGAAGVYILLFIILSYKKLFWGKS